MKDKLFEIILPTSMCFKTDLGIDTIPQLRHGRLEDSALHVDCKTINTRNGEQLFSSKIELFFKAFTDFDSVITIDIYDNDCNVLIKKFIIKSSNNNFSINDMKDICNEIISLLNSDSENLLIALIEFIRNKDNLVFEEIAQ